MMKRIRLHPLWLMFLVLVCVLAGCANVPYTGRNQLVLISQAQELQLGLQASQEIKQTERMSNDSRYTRPVQEIGWRVAQAANQPNYQWEFNVIDDPETVNAFCLPGGKIYVYTGLFQYAHDQHQLAAVIAHEVSHALARHGAERLSTGMLAQVGQELAVSASGVTSAEGMQAIKLAFGLGANLGVILPFSRTQEYEADRIGLILMAQAGYDPRAAVVFWENMLGKGSSLPEYFSTHPSTANRIEEIKRHLPEAMYYYQRR